MNDNDAYCNPILRLYGGGGHIFGYKASFLPFKADDTTNILVSSKMSYSAPFTTT